MRGTHNLSVAEHGGYRLRPCRSAGTRLAHRVAAFVTTIRAAAFTALTRFVLPNYD